MHVFAVGNFSLGEAYQGEESTGCKNSMDGCGFNPIAGRTLHPVANLRILSSEQLELPSVKRINK